MSPTIDADGPKQPGHSRLNKPFLPDGESVPLLYWGTPRDRVDGGMRRLLAFETAFSNCGLTTNVVTIPMTAATADTTSKSARRLSETKRMFLPVPLRRSVERRVDGLAFDNARLVVSLVPAMHRRAMATARNVWFDYPDRYSGIALERATQHRGLPKLTGRMQSAIWDRRERSEARLAHLISAASLVDSVGLGNSANWLPTPVFGEAPAILPRPGNRVAGMLANWHYEPNVKALKALVQEWAPLLRAEGYAISIAGYGAGQLPPMDQVSNMGEVQKPDDFYRLLDLVVMPITLGGGMKVKAVEAVAHGLPVLATAHVKAGLPKELHPAMVDLAEFVHDPGRVDRIHLELTAGRFRDPLSWFSQDRFTERVRELLISTCHAA